MRRLAIIAACLLAGAALAVFLVPAKASALPLPGLQKGAASDSGLQLVRRGGGFRGHAFRGRGFRGHAFRGRGFRGHAFRGRGFRGGRVYAFRGGRHWRGHGWRRHGWRWRGPRWGLALGAVGAPYFYGNCPLVRRTVWTPRGWRVRWVRRCW
jgi:hypothetical protein